MIKDLRTVQSIKRMTDGINNLGCRSVAMLPFFKGEMMG